MMDFSENLLGNLISGCFLNCRGRKALELPPLNLHGLRHAFATLSLVGGMAAKTVSEHLGHSSVVITLDLYSHVLPNMQKEIGKLHIHAVGVSEPYSIRACRMTG